MSINLAEERWLYPALFGLFRVERCGQVRGAGEERQSEVFDKCFMLLYL